MIGNVVTVTAWFERRAGSEESLLVLYDAVQAAEEVDLAEQARTDSLQAERDEEPSRDFIDTSDADDDEDTNRMTMSQAMGIVEHLLGGHSVP